MLCKLVYYFIINNNSIQIIYKAESLRWRVDEAGNKKKETFISLDNIFAKIYNVVIYRIYALLYNIKLGIEFTNIFDC